MIQVGTASWIDTQEWNTLKKQGVKNIKDMPQKVQDELRLSLDKYREQFLAMEQNVDTPTRVIIRYVKDGYPREFYAERHHHGRDPKTLQWNDWSITWSGVKGIDLTPCRLLGGIDLGWGVKCFNSFTLASGEQVSVPRNVKTKKDLMVLVNKFKQYIAEQGWN